MTPMAVAGPEPKKASKHCSARCTSSTDTDPRHLETSLRWLRRGDANTWRTDARHSAASAQTLRRRADSLTFVWNPLTGCCALRRVTSVDSAPSSRQTDNLARPALPRGELAASSASGPTPATLSGTSAWGRNWLPLANPRRVMAPRCQGCFSPRHQPAARTEDETRQRVSSLAWRKHSRATTSGSWFLLSDRFPLYPSTPGVDCWRE
jgi:hypothetical protein